MINRLSIPQKLIIPVIFFITGFCVSQNQRLIEIESLIGNENLDTSLRRLSVVDTAHLTSRDKGLYHFLTGKILKLQDKHDIGYRHLILSEDYFNKCNCLEREAYSNYELVDLLFQQEDSKIDVMPYLNEFVNYAEFTQIPIDLARANSKIASVCLQIDDSKNAILCYRLTIDELNKIPHPIGIASIESNIGTVYNSPRTMPDSALYYFFRALPVMKKNGMTGQVSNIYNNIAQAYINLSKYEDAINYYLKADSIKLNEYSLKTQIVYSNNLMEAYGALGDYKNAFIQAQKLANLKDSIQDSKQDTEIARFKEGFDNQKLRADNLEIEAKITKSKYIAFALGGGLLTVSLIGFLLFKNTKRKQRIAEQEKELEIQKTEKILKEQELTTIDAMIEGQEKERQRLASDLHDSVGATLSAARLQFDHISKNKDKLDGLDELFNKTGSLLEDAYNEVRSMAHVKNSGVIAKNGLLPAVQKLAKNASGASKLNISVEDFGLDNRLENSLEITIFRIIQELVTNIIKHADASEATISITQHKDSLSIIVEDNGRGFDAQKFQQKEGMGLSGIEKRIEHLEGTLEVDSTPSKGTSVLIDIPL